jgi:hypothetical protein
MKRIVVVAMAFAIAGWAVGGSALAQQNAPGWGMGGMGSMGAGPSAPHYSMHYSWFGPGQGRSCFMMTDENGAFPSIEQRLDFMRTTIGITEAQLPQWNAYAQAVGRSLETMRAAYQTMMNTMMSLNFVERFNLQLNAMNSHLAQLQQVTPALSAVYAVLTPEQKAKADGVFRSMGCYP